MTTKANCILLNVRGKHFYAEEFGKFIEIEKWEYDRILNNPNLYYFSTALKKHFEWCAAVGKTETVTFSDALGQTHTVRTAEDETGSPVEGNQATLETGNTTPKPIALLLAFLRDTIEEFPTGLTKLTLLSVTIAAITAFVAYNSHAPNHNAPSDSTVAESPEIRRALPVEPEIRRAIPVQPEIRKAVPVDLDVSRPIPADIIHVNANRRSVFTVLLNGYGSNEGRQPKLSSAAPHRQLVGRLAGSQLHPGFGTPIR